METLQYFHNPTISESLGNGWFTMKKYFFWLLLVLIICSLFDSPARFTYKADHFTPALFGYAAIAVIAAFLVFFLLRPVIAYGGKLIYLESARDKTPEMRYLFIGFQKNYLNIVLAHLLNVFIVAFGLFLLIIPGIVFACRLAFIPYLVMDKDCDPVTALEESWRMTKGYGWTIFGLALMAIPIFLLGLICLVVGIFPALIWINVSFASLYQAVLTERNAQPAYDDTI